MVRGVAIQTDPHGRLRVTDVLCVGRNGIHINDVFNTRFELQMGKRQFVVGGYLHANEAGDLIFPYEAIPEKSPCSCIISA